MPLEETGMWEPMMDRVFAEPRERIIMKEPIGDRVMVETYDNEAKFNIQTVIRNQNSK